VLEVATELGQLIRLARHRSGLTLEDVAEKVGITPGALSHIESGRRLPQAYNAVAIAEVLNVPREEMLRVLDEEHSHRRRSSADNPPSPSHDASFNEAAPAMSSFAARPIEDLFGEASSEPLSLRAPRVRPAPSRQRSGSSRDMARWSDDPDLRLRALEQLAGSAAEAIRTLRGLLADEDPAISREARRLLHELDVRLPEE
jgi:transcriptional regulator with XRE-family HTH domain